MAAPRLLAYCRVSTDEQADQGHSLRQQADLSARYCDLHGYTLAGVIEDPGVSAGTPLERRPGGRELLARLEAGEADGVVIRDLDRLFRLTLDGLQTFAVFDRAGVVVHAVADRIDTETPEGKLALTIRLATAEFERNKTAQRTRATMAALRESGRPYGHAPYGTVEQAGRLVREPRAWAVRERIVALRGGAQLGYRAICTELNDEGLPAPGGGQWHPSTVRRICETHHELEHIGAAALAAVQGGSAHDGEAA